MRAPQPAEVLRRYPSRPSSPSPVRRRRTTPPRRRAASRRRSPRIPPHGLKVDLRPGAGRRRAPALQVRADHDRAGPEQHRDQRAPTCPQPEGRRLDRRHPPQPRSAPTARVPPRRRHPPAPRRLAEPRRAGRDVDPGLPERFFAAGEEKTHIELPAGLRLRVQDHRHAGSQLHAPQPHCRSRTRCGSPTTSTSSPRRRPRPPSIKPAAPDLDGRAERRDLPGVRRAQGQRHQRRVHLPRRRRPTRTKAARRRTSGPSTSDGMLLATAGHLHPGGLHDDL